VAAYRALLRLGWYRRVLPIRPAVSGPFFDWPVARPPGASFPAGIDAAAWEADAERVIAGDLPVLSDRWVATGFPPAWDRSVLTGIVSEGQDRHWSDLPDFGGSGGDVKGYWEPARFDGLLILALGRLVTGRSDLQDGIERWLSDWAAQNPANAGVQWKCGQETGIRLMHVLLVARLLSRWDGAQPTDALRTLVAQHCERISRTMMYAVGQDNNHGTSEAAALFAGGTFLSGRGSRRDRRRARAWCRSGRRWLENRISRLVMPDGSFSQHSVNYHRLLLDTCSFIETWRDWQGSPPFSGRFTERCGRATEWLAAFTDPISGDAPNLGANDGSRLFVLHRSPFRDHRPSVRWAAAAFAAPGPHRPPGPWDERLAWLGLASDDERASATSESRLFPDGGYAKLSAGPAWLALRLPVYRFRPSQPDALHLDLWVDGENLVRDAGSYSYADDRWLRSFAGTASHSTVQFDGRDQMPRLSRFLYGDWLTCDDLVFDHAGGSVAAGYRDGEGAQHRREVRLETHRAVVTDTVSGFASSAVLRWRLLPGDWTVTDDGVTSSALALGVASGAPVIRRELVDGEESRIYARRTSLPVLEVEVDEPTTLVTELRWRA
jgi:hypothetical protein